MNKWNKKEYLECITKYYRVGHDYLYVYKECAEEDWERYLEKYNQMKQLKIIKRSVINDRTLYFPTNNRQQIGTRKNVIPTRKD